MLAKVWFRSFISKLGKTRLFYFLFQKPLTQPTLFLFYYQTHKKIMSDKRESVDGFTHELAIELSRALNLTNPNDLLAKRVVQLAKNDKNFDRFATGNIYTQKFKTFHSIDRVTSNISHFKAIKNELIFLIPFIIINNFLFLLFVLFVACQTFGRFQRDFLLEAFNNIQNHLQSIKSSSREQSTSSDRVKQISDGSSGGEVLMLGNNLPGGLITRNKSSKEDDVRLYLRIL